MFKALLAAASIAALAVALASLAYANHLPDPATGTAGTPAVVSLANKQFGIGSYTYRGGDTWNVGAETTYYWTVNNNDKVRHIFEVEVVGGAELYEFDLPKGSTAPTTVTFSVSAGATYKIYCPLHQKTNPGMVFYLTP